MITDPIHIRRATAADANAIARFNIDLAAETEGLQLDSPTVVSGVKAIFARPERGFYLLAEVSGKTVGCLLITHEWSDWRNADFWWMQSVYVAPSHRRRGVFRALLRHLHADASARADVCGVRLYVLESNERAKAVYRESGFHRTGYHILGKSTASTRG